MHDCLHRDDIKEIRSDIKTILQRTATLEVKAGIWGLLGGAVPVIVLLLIKNFGG